MATVPPKPLLVELFVEELPPKALPRLGAAFAEGLGAGLRARIADRRERGRHRRMRRRAGSRC